MTDSQEPVEFWSELDDLPMAVIDFANGLSPEELLETCLEDDLSDADIKAERDIAQRNVALLCRGEVNSVGKTAVDALRDGRVVWKSHYDWSDGLRLRTEGLLSGATFSLGIAYATARLANLVAQDNRILLKCSRCGNYALLDKRGGGGRNKQKWCSTRCRNAEAVKRRREREMLARKN